MLLNVSNNAFCEAFLGFDDYFTKIDCDTLEY